VLLITEFDDENRFNLSFVRLGPYGRYTQFGSHYFKYRQTVSVFVMKEISAMLIGIDKVRKFKIENFTGGFSKFFF
jgi:hypothetical protein